MKNKIEELITKKPKHFSKIIKNNVDLLNWVNSNSLIKSSNFSAMIYSAIHNVSNICKDGNEKRYISISEGFGFCGMTGKCACAKSHVSAKVSATKSLDTPEEKLETNKKREITTFKKYNVTNNGQTKNAIANHQALYNDTDKVNFIIKQMQATCFERYNVPNPYYINGVAEKKLVTLQERYGVTNPGQMASVKERLRARMAIQTEEGMYRNAGFNRFSKYVTEKYNVTLITTQEQYNEDKISLAFKCCSCGHEFNKNFYYSLSNRCPLCFPKIPTTVSAEEQAVYDMIYNDIGITNGYQSDRSILKSHELDMVFPQFKVAVEYCGLYYHSNNGKGNKPDNYHISKMTEANANGYRLITIFSDEWINKREIVKSKLTSIFQLSPTLHARKCSVGVISNHEANEFMDRCHLQGHAQHKIAIGLKTNEGTLVSVMTFATGRVAIGSSYVSGEYELVRFASDIYNIRGGASKLLTYFERNYKPTKVTSFADLRWSEGNVYIKLGFTLDNKTKIAPNYWYVEKYNSRIHRYNLRKDVFVKLGADSKLTEWQIAQSLGYDRIWDCGNAKYVKHYIYPEIN